LKKLNLIKSSCPNSKGALNRLSICLGVVCLIGKTGAIAQLWHEFLIELRKRYDNNILLSDILDKNKLKTIDFTQPDLSCSLIHQKLQMLNCCIRKRIERNEYELSKFHQKPIVKNNDQEEEEKEEEEEEEDQFFDCEEIEQQQQQLKPPEGRMKQLNNLNLLNDSSQPLYIPFTQVNKL
jgi:Rab3 GTPase-activating protein catalytic subunit